MSKNPTVSSWIQLGIDKVREREKIPSVRKVAEFIHVSPTSLNAWLRGERIPVRRLAKLAQSFFPDDQSRQDEFARALSASTRRAAPISADPLQALTVDAQPLELRYIKAAPLADPDSLRGGFFDRILSRFTVFANLRTSIKACDQAEFFRMAGAGEFEGHMIFPVLCSPKRLLHMFFVNTPLRLGPMGLVLRGNARQRDEIADALRVSPENPKAAEKLRQDLIAIVTPGEVGDEYVRALAVKEGRLKLVDEAKDGTAAFAEHLRAAGTTPAVVVVDELTAARLVRESRAELDLVFPPEGPPPTAPYYIGLVTRRAWVRYSEYADYAFDNFCLLDQAFICDQLVELYGDLRDYFEGALKRARRGSAANLAASAAIWARRVIGLSPVRREQKRPPHGGSETRFRGPRTMKFASSPAWEEVLAVVGERINRLDSAPSRRRRRRTQA